MDNWIHQAIAVDGDGRTMPRMYNFVSQFIHVVFGIWTIFMLNVMFTNATHHNFSGVLTALLGIMIYGVILYNTSLIPLIRSHIIIYR